MTAELARPARTTTKPSDQSRAHWNWLRTIAAAPIDMRATSGTAPTSARPQHRRQRVGEQDPGRQPLAAPVHRAGGRGGDERRRAMYEVADRHGGPPVSPATAAAVAIHPSATWKATAPECRAGRRTGPSSSTGIHQRHGVAPPPAPETPSHRAHASARRGRPTTTTPRPPGASSRAPGRLRPWPPTTARARTATARPGRPPSTTAGAGGGSGHSGRRRSW